MLTRAFTLCFTHYHNHAKFMEKEMPTIYHKKCVICGKTDNDDVNFVKVKIYDEMKTPPLPRLDLSEELNRQQKLVKVKLGQEVCSDHFAPKTVARYTNTQRPVPLAEWSKEKVRPSSRKPPTPRDSEYVHTPKPQQPTNTPQGLVRAARRDLKGEQEKVIQATNEVSQLREERRDDAVKIRDLEAEIERLKREREELLRKMSSPTIDLILAASKKPARDCMSWFGVANFENFYGVVKVREFVCLMLILRIT